ncbi:MAG: DegV family protein [Candidatus Heimdallarchaeaceae archaeon]
MSIRFVVDSSSDIDRDFAKKEKIKIVPLNIIFDEEKVIKEDENFDLDSYYKMYEEDKNFFVKTSQPLPRDYYEAYQELIQEGAKEIVVICLSSGLSSTINSATVGKKMMERENKEIKIHIVDSLGASYGEGLLLEKGLKLAKEGYLGEEIAEKLREHIKNISTYLFLPTLKYLHKGGRISTPKYFIGKILQKKPITFVNEKGQNELIATVTNTDEGFQKLIEFATRKNTVFPKRVIVVHSYNLELAKKMKKLVEEKIPDADISILCTGVTISAHTGPNMIALISEFEN